MVECSWDEQRRNEVGAMLWQRQKAEKRMAVNTRCLVQARRCKRVVELSSLKRTGLGLVSWLVGWLARKQTANITQQGIDKYVSPQVGGGRRSNKTRGRLPRCQCQAENGVRYAQCWIASRNASSGGIQTADKLMGGLTVSTV
jgi:hypothetical protein